MFYGNGKRAITSFNDVNMELNHGSEFIVRILNNTGVTIVEGTPVYDTGIPGNQPSVAPANADTIEGAKVIGITTYDLLNGGASEGFVTRAGELGGDFSGFSVGDVLFVADSSSVLNIRGLTNVAPDLASRVGQVLKNTVGGLMLVNVDNLIALPVFLAFMKVGILPTTITTSFQTITNYTISDGVVLVFDPVAGTITVPSTGFYRVTINMSLTHNSTGNGRPWFEVNIGATDASSSNVIRVGSARDSEGKQLTVSILFSAVTGISYWLQVRAESTINNVASTLMSFDIESVHIRI